MATNPRSANGAARRKARAWVIATYDHCALCGHLVDKNLKHPHPMSASVDEIKPVSLGGSPIDRKNLQLTHLSCNQRKGNGTKKSQISSPLPLSQEW